MIFTPQMRQSRYLGYSHLLFFLFLFFLLSHCGYHIKQTQPASSMSLLAHVAATVDSTHELGAAARLTQRLRLGLQTTHVFQMVSKATAQIVIEPQLQSIEDAPGLSAPMQPGAQGFMVSKFNIRITGCLIIKQANGDILFTLSPITVTEDYFSALSDNASTFDKEGALPRTESYRRLAISRGIDALAEQLLKTWMNSAQFE